MDNMDWGNALDFVSFGHVNPDQLDDADFYILVAPQNVVGSPIILNLIKMVGVSECCVTLFWIAQVRHARLCDSHLHSSPRTLGSGEACIGLASEKVVGSSIILTLIKMVGEPVCVSLKRS